MPAPRTRLLFRVRLTDYYAIIRLSSYTAEDEHGERDKTWFKVRDAETVRLLRAYVSQTLAAETEQDKATRRRYSGAIE